MLSVSLSLHSKLFFFLNLVVSSLLSLYPQYQAQEMLDWKKN